MPKPVAALLAAVLVASALAACGGGSSSDGTGGSTGGKATAPGSAQPSQGEREAAKEKIEAKIKKLKEKQAKAGSKAQGGGGEPSHHRKANVPPLKVSGGGSARYRTKGGDNSIQNYGEESGESELQAAAAALHDFYVARAEERWERACSYLAKSIVQQFEQLISRTPQLKGEGCGAALHALTRPLPPSVEREITEIDAVSLRREGERGFLLYRGAENKVYAVPMLIESGAWKTGSISGTPLD